MRMRKSQKKAHNMRRRVIKKNSEGGDVEAYAEAIEIEATIWQASGKVQAEMYGERLAYMKNMEYEGAETITEGDGICVNVPGDEDPDYKVTSKNADHSPIIFLLERI